MSASAQSAPQPIWRRPPPGVIPLHLLLATSAKVLSSALFVSRREFDEAWRNSVFHALQIHHLSAVLPELVQAQVDDQAHEVTLTLPLDAAAVARIIDAYRAQYPDFEADWAAEAQRLVAAGRVTRKARFTGSQGSVILPADGDQALRFQPVAVRSALPDAATQAWPMGDATRGPTAHPNVDRQAIEAAFDVAFADPSGQTAAAVVVHRGEIIAERYRAGFGIDTQFESWSMGKSVTATLLGVLVQQGLLSLDEPAPVPAWQQAGDPRAAITVRHLLQMSSGLQCSGPDEPRARWRLGLPDHFYVYGEACDTFAFALDRPSEHPPGTVGRYRNCDPLTLGYLIRRTVEDRLGENYHQWPQKALFDRIGIRSQILETDLYGNFVMTGFDYGTARNWARLGLLYLRNGLWQGQRVLPDYWADVVRGYAPAWKDHRYGGQFWLNPADEFALPRDAFSMAGASDQRVFIVPSADLVIVRLGHQSAHATVRRSLNTLLGAVIRAVSR
ncbi:MAG: serine hydrolase [Burkholderiales bacterium]|nr:serine hydrolase [Burkholderiales bacterium]